MSDVWLQVAAVNFATTIYDTNDLSVIRGASFAVLQASDELLNELDRRLADRQLVEPLYSGASELVVRIASKPAGPAPVKLVPPGGGKQQWRQKTLPNLVQRVAAGEELDAVAAAAHGGFRNPNVSRTAIARQIEFVMARESSAAASPAPLTDAELETHLRAALQAQAETLRHFTFVHAIHRPAPKESLPNILAALTTRIRLAQLQSLTVALPDEVPSLADAASAFCSFTLGRQPVAPGKRVKGKPASASVQARQRMGRDDKTSFYREQVRRGLEAAKLLVTDKAQSLAKAQRTLDLQSMPVAMDFGELVADPPPGLPPNVEGKLAVLFMDGNGFGRLRQRCAEIPDPQRSFQAFRRFCLTLEQNNAIILGDLVDWMLQAPGFTQGADADRRLRFETLLWGGDDVSLVLPAWGVSPFLEQLDRVLRLLRLPVGDRSETPSYKIGVVLAQHKSPIRDLRMAAERLAEAAKATSDTRSVVQLMALEGIDRAEFDPASVRGELFDDALGNDFGAFGIFLEEWPKVVRMFNAINDGIGRSQLHRWYRKAEKDGLLKLDRSAPGVAAFAAELEARLHALAVDAAVVDVLVGRDPVLAHGAERWPLLPLHHVLALADYVTAELVSKAAQARAA